MCASVCWSHAAELHTSMLRRFCRRFCSMHVDISTNSNSITKPRRWHGNVCGSSNKRVHITQYTHARLASRGLKHHTSQAARQSADANRQTSCAIQSGVKRGENSPDSVCAYTIHTLKHATANDGALSLWSSSVRSHKPHTPSPSSSSSPPHCNGQNNGAHAQRTEQTPDRDGNNGALCTKAIAIAAVQRCNVPRHTNYNSGYESEKRGESHFTYTAGLQ